MPSFLFVCRMFFGGVLSLFILWEPLIAQAPLLLNSTQHIGQVRQVDGVKKVDFAYAYEGERITYLENIESVCHCVGVDRERLPILPGEEGTICLHFLPSYHVGDFEETIKIFFNGIPTPTLLTLTGRVVPVPAESARYFPFAQGHLRLAWRALHMGILYRDKAYTRSFPLYNTGEEPLHLAIEKLPDYLSVSFVPTSLPPKEVGNVVIRYCPAERARVGYLLDTLHVQTNDERQPIKALYVAGTLLADVPPQTTYAQLVFTQRKKSFGKVRAGVPVQMEFSFKNTGTEVLEIYEVRPLCDCLQIAVSTQVLSPAASGTLVVRLNTDEQVGTQRRSVLFFSNDPVSPMQGVRIEGYVKKR